jgi:hypothetical protein
MAFIWIPEQLDFHHLGTAQLASMKILNLLTVLGVGVFGSLLAIPSGVGDDLSVADKADEDCKPLLNNRSYVLLHFRTFPSIGSHFLHHTY